jgi:hypothetical protein
MIFNSIIVKKLNKRFFKWCDMKFDLAYRPNLVVYPEGHRMGVARKAA